MQPLRQPGGYTVADYMRWPDDIRCELIDGMIFDMSPAPAIAHQRLLAGLGYVLQQLLERRKGSGGCDACELFMAPIDVVYGAGRTCPGWRYSRSCKPV